MGNARSQPCKRGKSLYLFYLIHRTWSVVVDHRKDQDRCDETDRETDLSSKCSTCNACDYRHDSLTFDSESDMAPNAEEELLVVKPWGTGPQPEKERLRPPTYNAEDYAIALRRWGRRPLGSVQDSQGTLPSTTSSSSGYASGSGEMTLRQFTSVSELLNKLRADLRLAFPSFVQEFASPPADGITLLLETLRGVQLAQSSPPNSGQTGPRVGTRRAALDELGCVECLAACGERCADAPRLLVQAQPGLLALAVCLTSSLNRSRVLALQLLTKVCQTPGGHAAVSEAVSTLRLKYGEGGRFRFLAGALLAPRAAIALRVAGVSFLNAFLRSAPRTQTRLYIQAEACEAGLEPQVLQEWLREFDGREEDALTDLLHKEVQKWTHNCVDVDALQRRVIRAEETCRILSKKVSLLQMQLEKRNERGGLEEQNQESTPIHVLVAAKRYRPKVSSNAEDEGISSSERSSSPEDTKHQARSALQKTSQAAQNNDQETTIDDVIEELRIIVKDAEEEFSDKTQELNRCRTDIDQEMVGKESTTDKLCRSSSKVSLNNSETYTYDKRERHANPKTRGSNADSGASRSPMKGEQVTYFGNQEQDYSTDSSGTKRLSPGEPCRSSKTSMEGSVRIVVKGPDVEEAIVPAILHPQPPRRAPPCLSAIMASRHCDFGDHVETYNSHDEEAEEETLGDDSDSLLSASRLKYNKHQMYDGQTRTVNVNQSQKQAKSDTVLIGSNHVDVKFRKSLDDLRNFEESDKKNRKTLRNYEITSGPRMIAEIGQLDVYRQFESAVAKGFETASGRSADQRTIHRHGSKYRSEVEKKRKYLRRSASHDYLESNVSSPQSRRSGSKVECHIRKFESLNSFDEHRSLQNYGRSNTSEGFDKREQTLLLLDTARSKMRRSESFHHVTHHASSKRDQCSSKGESDSGLFYVTDFNLEPVVARRPRSIDAPKSPSLLTKSLDRIDEGLDSMVDIVITQEQSQWNASKRQSKASRIPRDDRQLTRSRSVKLQDEFRGNSSEYTNVQSRRDGSVPSTGKHVENDELRHANNKQLRSDELYEEQRNREWNYHNELNYARSKGASSPEDSPIILSKNGMKHNSFCPKTDNIGNKFSGRPNESSGIFVGRTYDTFGLGKSRFNAGKYSENQQIKESPIGRRNTASSLMGKRGKVTDVVSGLY